MPRHLEATAEPWPSLFSYPRPRTPRQRLKRRSAYDYMVRVTITQLFELDGVVYAAGSFEARCSESDPMALEILLPGLDTWLAIESILADVEPPDHAAEPDPKAG